MSRLIVAVDGSKHSEKVVDVACQVAKDLSASILLVHILRGMPEEPEGVKAFEEAEHYREAYTDYLKEVAKDVMEKLGARIDSQGVSYMALTEFGNPVEKILDAARVQESPIIVVGLHGRHYVGRIRTLGSVARTVMENATCPVLVVP
jgi:nucleotide-binding universal stress UspA family protein